MNGPGGEPPSKFCITVVISVVIACFVCLCILVSGCDDDEPEAKPKFTLGQMVTTKVGNFKGQIIWCSGRAGNRGHWYEVRYTPHLPNLKNVAIAGSSVIGSNDTDIALKEDYFYEFELEPREIER